MQENYKKTIVSAILGTLAVLVVLFAIIIMLMFFVFTKNMADICYNLGCDKIASTLYYRTYEKNDDIFYCYKALNIKIKIGDNNNIVKYYEEFVSDENYTDFMTKLVEKNESLLAGILEKSTLVNEDNYLKNHYIKALIEVGDQGKALTTANLYFNESSITNIKHIGVYTYNNFVSKKNVDKFTIEQDGVVLLTKLQDYFDNLVVLFNDNKTTNNSLEKAYIVSLGNRIIEVGRNINFIYNEVGNVTKIDSNNVSMLSINEDIKNVLKG